MNAVLKWHLSLEKLIRAHFVIDIDLGGAIIPRQVRPVSWVGATCSLQFGSLERADTLTFADVIAGYPFNASHTSRLLP